MPAGLVFPINYLVDAMHWILDALHSGVGSWGLAIILLTIIVKTCLFPLMLRQAKSMQRLTKVQPLIKALQEQYAGQPEKRAELQSKMVEVYKDNKVNPIGALIPIIVQAPVFISLLYFLQSETFKTDIVSSPSFLFLDNLSKTITGDVWQLVAAVGIYYLVQLLALFAGARRKPTTAVRKLFFLMPFFFGAFLIHLPSGVILYSITAAAFTIGQSLILKRMVPSNDDVFSEVDELVHPLPEDHETEILAEQSELDLEKKA